MRVSQNSQRPKGRRQIFSRGHCAAAFMLAAWPVSVLAAADLPSVFGIPVDFILFALTLLGVRAGSDPAAVYAVTAPDGAQLTVTVRYFASDGARATSPAEAAWHWLNAPRTTPWYRTVYELSINNRIARRKPTSLHAE